MSGATCRMRALGPLDVAEAARIHLDCFGYEAWDEQAMRDVLGMPRAAGIMAVDSRLGDRKPLGFALYMVVFEDAELLTLAVCEDARRQGIGTALMGEFFRRARLAGARQALLEVAEDNVQARRLYAQIGFKEEGRRPDYYRRAGNKHVAARLLRRQIPANSSESGSY